MKASFKFREDQKPLFRAKVPISVLGLPFQSGIVAGDSKELSLNLSTLFESGPSLKISYRPNDSWNPFSLVVKTGIGNFGSSISSPMTMSAEFNLLSNGNPSFFLHFKPQIGDFSIKKSAGSSINLSSTVFPPKIKSHVNDADSDFEGYVDAGVSQLENHVHRPENGIFPGKKKNIFSPDSHIAGTIDNLINGVEFFAGTTLPVKNRLRLKFRWGVKCPSSQKTTFAEYGIGNPTAEISLSKIPFLALKKVGIEHVAESDWKEGKKVGPVTISPVNAELAETCFMVKREIDVLQVENGLLRKDMEDLRREIIAGKSIMAASFQDPGKGWDSEMHTSGKFSLVKKDDSSENSVPEFSGFTGKVKDEVVK